MIMNLRHSKVLSEYDAEPVPGRIKHTLPPLPYAYDALEPYIDTRTLTLHHDKHHASYVTNLNTVLDKYPELHARTADWLLCNLSQVPQTIRAAVHHNVGGHVNHSLFWLMMSPTGGGAPTGPLAGALNRDFGGFEQFKAGFEEAGNKLFGSGWVWLVREQKNDGPLQIITTAGHDHPMMKGHYPLLVNDVWEHAYYLKYENRRADYLHGWWSIVNWEAVSRRFESSDVG
ncbi:MAG: superoxide dismutase [Burkholderiales bacterium]|nr:superoxide dismutase [Burkholderiales bacterium]